MEVAKCTPLWRKAHCEVKMHKKHHSRTTFGSCDVEKVHAVVARSTFPSQNVQNTPFSDHFWKFRCRKSARRCGAKHISKSKCTKHTILGPLLEVQMSKKCTPLWREAHFQVKMYKTYHSRTTFGSSDVEKVHAVVARSTFPSQNAQNTPFSDHFWKFRCRKSARRCGAKHISKSKCTKHHMFAPLFKGSDVEKVHAVVARSTLRSQNVQNTRGSDHFWRLRCHFASLHYTTLHHTTQHYNHNYTTTQLHSTTLNYTPLHSTTLNYTPLHYSTFHYTSLQYITLHSTTSSTAQGGGGSFKNRKPIGEVGCCESGMAERSQCWSERWLISLTISLSFSDYLPTYPPTYLSIYLCIYRSIYLPTYLSIYLSNYLSIYLSLSLSSVYLSSCLPVYLSIYLSICLSVCLSVYLPICGAVSFSVM